MKLDQFGNSKKFFSVVLFIQPDDVSRFQVELETVGKLPNVKLIVQPCPFEGIEFLCRVSAQLIGHRLSVEKDFFWQAMELKRDTPEKIVDQVANHQHEYLCSILDQDASKVEKEGRVLQSFSDHYF